MSSSKSGYARTKCPCLGRKLAGEMFCSDCIDHFALQGRRELDDYMDPNLSLEYRRHCAIVLLSLAYKRGGRYVDWRALGTYARPLPEAS